MNNTLIIAQFIKYFLTFAIIFDATIAWFVLLKNPKRPVNQAYFFMITCITLWQAGNYVSTYIILPDTMQHVLVTRFAFAAAAVLLPAALYFVSVFPDQQHQPRRVAWLSLIAFGTVLLSFSPWVIAQSTTTLLSFGPAYILYVTFMAAFTAIVFVTIILRWTATRFTREQIQFQYLCLGLTVPMLFGLFTNLLVPFQAYLSAPHQPYQLIGLENFGPATTVFLSAVTGYSILRYRLLNMNILIQRNTITTASSLLAGGIIFGLLLVAAKSFDVIVASSTFITTTTVVIIAITAFIPLRYVLNWLMRRWCKPQVLNFHKWTEEEIAFFKRSANPTQFARSIAVSIQKQLPVESLHCIVYDHPARCFRMVYPVKKYRTFAMDEPWIAALGTNPEIVEAGDSAQRRDVQRKLKQYKANFIIPLHYNDQLVGILCIGAKVDGTAFSSADTLWLKRFQRSAAVHLWNVLQLQHAVYTGVDQGLVEKLVTERKMV